MENQFKSSRLKVFPREKTSQLHRAFALYRVLRIARLSHISVSQCGISPPEDKTPENLNRRFSWPPDYQSRFQIILDERRRELFSSRLSHVARVLRYVSTRCVIASLFIFGARRAQVRGKCHHRHGGKRAGEAGENVLEAWSVQTSEL